MRRGTFFASVLLATAALPLPASGQGTINYDTAWLDRKLVAVRTQETIALDGVLDEAAWQAAPVARDFIQNDPQEGRPATFDTEVRVLYDGDALYFGVFAHDDEPEALIVSDLKKDFNVNTSDLFRVIIDTFDDRRNGYQFATNPAGAKWDAQTANEGRENNVNWDGIWEVRTRTNDDGWVAEIKIPLLTLKFREQDSQNWGVNFERRLRRLNEDSYWSPLPRIYNLDRVSLAGTIDGIQGLQPGRNLRVKPYALSNSATVGGVGSNNDFDAGLDVKYGVTNGLTLDATVNTDFSQAEADEQQVNLSRFSLFFPEKRDFFLENSGIFQFGSSDRMGGGGAGGGRQNASQDMQVFFSRRIGLSDAGQAIPILAGGRLTGRTGGYSLGVLNIQQREVENDLVNNRTFVPATNFTAIRVRRDILKNSDIGAVLLNKDLSGSAYNRVGGVDANFRFGFLSLNGFAAKSAVPFADAPGSGQDLATRASFNYQSRVIQVRGQYSGIGQRFIDQMGFVPRLGVDNMLVFGGYAFRPRWASRLGVREIRPHWQMDLFRRQESGELESRYQDFHLPFNFNNTGFLEVGVNPNVEVIRRSFPINAARGVTVDPGRYDFNEYFVTFNSNSSARFSMNTRFSVGGFYDGNRTNFVFGPTVRLNEHFNASASLQINDIELTNGAYVSTLVTSRVNYNFNTRMFVNALLQFNTDTHQWSSNLRFNFIHRPLSDIFLVYNDRRDERTGALIDRAVIAKMTYMMAF